MLSREKDFDTGLGIFDPLTTHEVCSVKSLYSNRWVEKSKRIARTKEGLIELLNDNDCVRTNISAELRNVKAVRFLLTIDNRLVFGPEGIPDLENDVPAHVHLTETENLIEAECITAGMAGFTEDNKLIFIDHQSGDFRPSFNSLQFVLPHFVSLSIPMADSIRINELNSAGSFRAKYLIESATLISGLSKEENSISTNDNSLFANTSKKQHLKHGPVSIHIPTYTYSK